MELKLLPRDVQTKIHNGCLITTIAQCVAELVLNSLDAKSTAIAIRVNLSTFRIQVVDNGNGISESNMAHVGIQHMTNKCQSLSDLNHIKTFGLRGEALSGICGISKKLTIESKSSNTELTCKKIFEDTKWSPVETVKQRPSQGTTVTVDDFMYNLPVRQNRINKKLDLDEIKRNLELLAIIHHKVSFNLRNDATGNLIFQCSKSKSVSDTLHNFYPDISSDDLLSGMISKHKIQISGLIYKKTSTNHRLQLVYINKRPVLIPRIQQLVKSLLTKSLIFEASNDSFIKHPVYVINISCFYSQVDVLVEPSKTVAEFKNWNVILKSIEKLINRMLECENLIKLPTEKSNAAPKCSSDNKALKSPFGMSVIDAIRSKLVKRKIASPNLNQSEDVDELKDKKKNLNKDLDLVKKDAKESNENQLPLQLETNCFGLTIHDDSNDGFKAPRAKKAKKARAKNNKPKNTAKKPRRTRRAKPTNFLLDSPSDKALPPLSIEKNKYKALPNTECTRIQMVEDTKELTSADDVVKAPKSPKNIFEKHLNTQSLVLNSEMSTSKQGNKDLNSTVNTVSLNNQEKGKNVIMDMFLKSTVAFPNEVPEDIDSKTVKTVVIRTTHKNFVKQCKSHHTIVTASMKITSKKTTVTNALPAEKVDYKNNNEQKDNVKRKMVSKCIQTMTDKEKEINFSVDFSKIDSSKNIKMPFFQFFNNDARKSRKTNHKFNLCTSGCNLRNNFQYDSYSNHKKEIYFDRFHRPFLGRNEPRRLYYRDFDYRERSPGFYCCNNQNVFDNPQQQNNPYSYFEYMLPPATPSFLRQHMHHSYKPNYFRNPTQQLDNIYGNQFYPSCNNCKTFKRKYEENENDLTMRRKKLYESIMKDYPENDMDDLRYKELYEPCDIRRNERHETRKIDLQNNVSPFFTTSKRCDRKNDCHRRAFENVAFCNGESNTYRSPFFTIDKNSTYSQFKCNFPPKITRHQNCLPFRNQPVNKNRPTVHESNANQHFFMDKFKRNIFSNCEQNYSPFFKNDTIKYHQGHKRAPVQTAVLNTSEISEDITKLRNGRCILSPTTSCFVNTIPIQTNTKDILVNETAENNWNKIEENEESEIIDCTPEILKTASNFQNLNKPAGTKGLIQKDDVVTQASIFTKCKENAQNVEENALDFNFTFNMDGLIETKPSNTSLEKLWTQRIDDHDNIFFLHKKTGMNSMFGPKQDNPFTFAKRLDFIPKGLSPVLQGKKHVEMHLSPTSKKILIETILQDYENELSSIKWSNYMQNCSDIKKFFEELYQEKAKAFEKTIPNINISELSKSLIKLTRNTKGQSFSKDIFNDLTIIGQWDCKFIITFSDKQKLLVLFDQHAVDERIRLEKLLNEYAEVTNDSTVKLKSTNIPEKMIIDLSEDDMTFLLNFKHLFNNMGLFFNYSQNGIEITHIPTCMHRKFKRMVKDNEQQLKLVTSLIYEEIKMIIDTRGVPAKIPATIQSIINSEACRGAVKFGDNLTTDECIMYINELSDCNLPFQCAHGRPSLTILMNFQHKQKIKPSRVNLNKLKP